MRSQEKTEKFLSIRGNSMLDL